MTYLAHHGILGMKWGVRRYQNPDGTLTEAGKKRYAKDISEGAFSRDKKKIQRLKEAKEAFANSVDISKYEKDVYRVRDLSTQARIERTKVWGERGDTPESSRLSHEAVDIVSNIGKEIVGDAGNAFVQNYVGEIVFGKARAAVLEKESVEKITNPKKYWSEINKDVHTTDLKTQQKILSDWNTDTDSLSGKEIDRCTELFKRIENESGSWYFNKPVTESFKNALDNYKKAEKEYELADKKLDDFNKKRNSGGLRNLSVEQEYDMVEPLMFDVQDARSAMRSAKRNLCRTALDDIGFNNKDEASIELVESMIFWD